MNKIKNTPIEELQQQNNIIKSKKILNKVAKTVLLIVSFKASAIHVEESIYPKIILWEANAKSINFDNFQKNKNEINIENITEEEKYKNFAKKLNVISDNRYFSDFYEALIQQESKWNNSVRSHSGAVGLAQLTSVVIKDMQKDNRWDIYIERLIKIKNNDKQIFGYLPKDLNKKLLLLDQKISDEKWNEILQLFQKYKHKNPYVNMLLWALVLNINLDLHTTVESSEKFYKELLKRLSRAWVNTNAVKKIYPKNPDERKMVQAIWRYNWNKSVRIVDWIDDILSWKKIKLTERDFHVVMVVKNYRENK